MARTIEEIGERTEPRGQAAVDGNEGEGTRLPRATGALWVEAHEYIWLDEFRSGIGTAEIAAREGLSARRVRLGVQRAKARERASYSRDSRDGELLRKRDERNSPVSRSATAGAAGRWPGRYPPKLVPFFPIGPFAPGSECPHRGPIRRGSRLCCMVCSKSGMDDHPALKRNPKTDPRPEPKAVPRRAKSAPRTETRKERRRRLFASPQDGPRQALAV